MVKQSPTVSMVIAGSITEWLQTARKHRIFDSRCPQITYAFTEPPAPAIGHSRSAAERKALFDRLIAVEWNEAYENLCGKPAPADGPNRLGADLCVASADVDPFELIFTSGASQRDRFNLQPPGRQPTSMVGEIGVIPLPDGRTAAGIWLTLFPDTESPIAADGVQSRQTPQVIESALPARTGGQEPGDLRKISHGLHNALAGIHQVLQLLLPKLPSDEVTQELAGYCHESLKRANEYAHEMRELVKGARGGTVSLKGLCEGAVSALAEDGLSPSAVRIASTSDAEYGGDAVALIQLLRGLIREASPALHTTGPLRLSAESGPGRLVFRIEAEQPLGATESPLSMDDSVSDQRDGSARDNDPAPLPSACHAQALQLGGRLLLERAPVRSITLDIPNPGTPIG